MQFRVVLDTIERWFWRLSGGDKKEAPKKVYGQATGEAS